MNTKFILNAKKQNGWIESTLKINGLLHSNSVLHYFKHWLKWTTLKEINFTNKIT